MARCNDEDGLWALPLVDVARCAHCGYVMRRDQVVWRAVWHGPGAEVHAQEELERALEQARADMDWTRVYCEEHNHFK